MMTITDAVEVKRLFDAGAHFAQVKSRRHPSMKPFLIGARGRQEIFDLSKTAAQLAEAARALETMARDGKTVLFVGGKTEIADLLRGAAERVGAPFVAVRWLGGTISNFVEIKKRIDRLAELSEMRAAGTLEKRHTKLEIVRLAREITRLHERLDGIRTLEKRPDALVVVDPRHARHAVKEARDAGIPIIALMSSDCNLAQIAYPILGNDASRATVALVLDALAAGYERGRAA